MTHLNFKLVMAVWGALTVWCVQPGAQARGARWSFQGGGSLTRAAIHAQAARGKLLCSRSIAPRASRHPVVRSTGTSPGRQLSRRTLQRLSPRVRGVLSYLQRTGKTGPATFDGDGTLWAGDVGLGFFDWMLRQRHYPAGRLAMLERAFRMYRRGHYDGEKFYELMVTAMAGMQESRVKQLADEYFRTEHRSRIYRPMINMVGALEDLGIEPWVVSGSPYWVVAAGARYLGIPTSRVIGLSVDVDSSGRLTNRIVRPVPWKAGKAKRIMAQLGQVPVFAAGNSYGDIQMLRIASEPPLVINPCPTTLREAQTNGWTVHHFTRADEIAVTDGQVLRLDPTAAAPEALRVHGH